jgi:ribosome biogenesis GTPase / thiamine phosphate phosphatase
MQEGPFAALVPFGWSGRVQALWNELGDPTLLAGRVVRVERRRCRVACAQGEERMVVPRVPVGVGDWVAIDGAAVTHLLPRWSAVTRLDPAPTGAQAGVQVLAANVDVVVVTAPADRLSVTRVERELALAWDSGARPLVVLTKRDLDGSDGVAALSSRLVGAHVLATSAKTGEGVDELRHALAPGVTGALLGPSGAGKSTLVNALIGDPVQDVGEVRESDHRGRHTTTSRQLLAIPGGGVLIDTPGLRSLALSGRTGIEKAFADVEALACECRFRDCRHRTEPGCEVLRAVERGTLDPSRLAGFHKLLREAEAERRRSDPVAARAARRLWSQRTREARRYDKRRLG